MRRSCETDSRNCCSRPFERSSAPAIELIERARSATSSSPWGTGTRALRSPAAIRWVAMSASRSGCVSRLLNRAATNAAEQDRGRRREQEPTHGGPEVEARALREHQHRRAPPCVDDRGRCVDERSVVAAHDEAGFVSQASELRDRRSTRRPAVRRSCCRRGRTPSARSPRGAGCAAGRGAPLAAAWRRERDRCCRLPATRARGARLPRRRLAHAGRARSNGAP